MESALLVSFDETERDLALQPRGERKLMVTRIFEESECEADDDIWHAADRCPVIKMEDTELATFTQRAKQTRHWHERGTEIYMVMKGNLRVLVEEKEYNLSELDMLIVKSGAKHKVQPKGEGEFLCRVINVNCGGCDDRYEG